MGVFGGSGYSVGYCRGRRWSVPSSRTSTGFVPRIVDHDGIENRFVGKASMVWYWFGGKWIQLSGTD
ncbi:MAG: hypothetical protein DMG72_05755 [Acidobacteria bacterium]|nr:MAG: hypothetical protein DMG72_05755 [Acidobacteriota bacterium]